MNPSKIEFQPVDGDIDRMTMYGCYEGDKFTYAGKTYVVEKDDVPRIELRPTIDMRAFDGKKLYELSSFERRRYNQMVEEGKRRMYAGILYVGDYAKTPTYEFSYRTKSHTIEVSRDETEEYTTKGWSIRCIDHQTPMKDVVMPDQLFGANIEFANNCFENAKNVASVAHISKYVGSLEMSGMFRYSGLRELPDQMLQQLESGNAWLYQFQISIGAAYALDYYEELITAIDDTCHRESHLHEIGSRDSKNYYESDIRKLHKNMNDDIADIEGELPKFVKFEKLSFMYKYQPVTVIRGQTANGNWYALNPGLEKYSDYGARKLIGMSESVFAHFDKFMADRYDNKYVQNLSTGEPPISEISKEEVIEEIKKIYGECIEEIEGRLNKLLDERREQCADARKQADRAQEGLNFTPKPVDVKVLCDYVYGKDKTDKEVIDK